MQTFTFRRNWCDYLTPCPYCSGTMIGEFDCVERCPYCKGHKENPWPSNKTADCSKYFDTWTGEVECSYPKY